MNAAIHEYLEGAWGSLLTLCALFGALLLLIPAPYEIIILPVCIITIIIHYRTFTAASHKRQPPPTPVVEVVIAQSTSATDWEKLGKFYIAQATIVGLPSDKFLVDNMYKLKKVTKFTDAEIRELQGKSFLLMHEYYIELSKPAEKAGYQK